ncbi:MAG: transcriptional repressor [Spirochaetales bacterium]|nr:transcriptional repressor [Spirochaetales bacterium]
MNELRRTEQRTVILEELRRASDHPAADEVYLKVKERLPHISLSTVYRNLELLAAEGLIRKIEHGGLQKRFDPVAEPHSHFHCGGCGRLEDLPFRIELPELDRNHPWVRARVIHGARIDYHGLCPSCAGGGRVLRRETPGE